MKNVYKRKTEKCKKVKYGTGLELMSASLVFAESPGSKVCRI